MRLHEDGPDALVRYTQPSGDLDRALTAIEHPDDGFGEVDCRLLAATRLLVQAEPSLSRSREVRISHPVMMPVE
jgi:hypothetical protein